MKLKERLRIAWQVLTKGTCDELKRAEQEKEKAVRVAETFEEFLRESDVEYPAVLTSGDGAHSIRLNEIQLNIIHPTEIPYYASASPQKQWLYTLHNMEGKFAFDMAARNADMLDYFQQQAVMEVAKALVRVGIIKTEVLSSPDEYNVKRVRYWVPYYRLEK